MRKTLDNTRSNPINALGADEDGKIRVYMCLTDYECELGLANCGHSVYPTLELCLELRQCANQCGVVRVVIEVEEIVQEPTGYLAEVEDDKK